MTPGEFTRTRQRTDIDTLKKMYPEIRAKAFAVTGVEDFERLQRIQESVAKLGEGGDWNKLRNQIADEIGRDRDGVKEHAETVLRTNGFQAFASARYRKQQAMADVFPYLKYVTVGDSRVRDAHAKLDGVILKADDPFWKDHYPPWGYNCRCLVVQLTEEDAKGEVEAGEGEIWSEATRQDWMARNRGIDETRDFHFRPDSLEMDLRDIAAAKNRTPEAMKDFGELMEKRRIGTGEFTADGKEKTVSVRDWMWKPVQREAHAKLQGGTAAEIALDPWTGLKAAEGGEKALIFKRPDDGLTLRDVARAVEEEVHSVEIYAGSSWNRVRIVAKTGALKSKLAQFEQDLKAASGNPARLSELKAAFDAWLADQRKAGALEVVGGPTL